MIHSIRRFDDDEIPVPPESAAELRAFFRSWRLRLLADSDG